MPTANTTVLIVDDDLTNRLILSSIVEQCGYRTLQAEDGQAAVAMFERELPDIVLMDVVMPRMDGYQATGLIKRTERGPFTPVIILTGLQDPDEIKRGVAAGGDDFLTKPYNPVAIESKMRALLRIRELHMTIRAQNDELRRFRQERVKEEEIAECIFETIVHQAAVEHPSVRYHVSPSSVFNGDLLLTAFRSTGELHVLVGDFTGHGLSAAIGTVPVSDTFYTMTSNGFSIGDIAVAVNERLKRMLPPHIFFAACLLSVDAVERRLTVWNGGMPDVLVVNAKNSIRARVRSTHVPMGILSASEFSRATDVVALNAGEFVYACTDGVIDTPVANGGRFGAEAYLECFDPAILPRRPFDMILDTIREIVGSGPMDDTTLLEISVDAALANSGAETTASRRAHTGAPWRMQFEFGAKTLREFDPVPYLLRGIMEAQGLARQKETLYTVLSELFSNALDHGVLMLNSELKAGPAGFAAYVNERARRLAAIENGHVRIRLENVPQGSGGRLKISVEDSGPGFDYKRAQLALERNSGFSGRGIPLLQSLCENVRFLGRGNEVEAVFVWSQ